MTSRPLREEVAEAIRQTGVGSNMEARAACAVIARRLREALRRGHLAVPLTTDVQEKTLQLATMVDEALALLADLEAP